MESKGKIVQDFEAEPQSPQVSILQMEDYARASISPEWAKSIVESFKIKNFNDSLIRTHIAYRENVDDPSKPRVSVWILAKFICDELGVEPDKKFMETASKMHGMGSHCELVVQACCKPLREKFGMEVEY